MVAPFGPLATMSREPRQARKGATVAAKSCAGVWLIGDTTLIYLPAVLALLFSSSFPSLRFPRDRAADIIDASIQATQCYEF